MRPPSQNPYHPPGLRAPKISAERERRSFLWWALLAAPDSFFLLAVGVGRVLLELGAPVSDTARESLIQAAQGFASGSVRAAFMFPSAWVLERVLRRRNGHRSHLRQLALKILVVSIYVLGTAEMLVYRGYVPEDGGLDNLFRVLNGLGILAVLPLVALWAIVAFRGRRRKRV
jgi:hypothetical protein